MKHEHYINRSLVLILWELTDDGHHDVKMFPGTLVHRHDGFFLNRGEGAQSLYIPEEWRELIVAVPPELKPLMKNCDYQLSLTAADILKKAEVLADLGLV